MLANTNTCQICSQDSFCPGGNYLISDTVSGIFDCPSGTYPPEGTSTQDDCGRILHIGNYVLYTSAIKTTTPALNVLINGNVFYGKLNKEKSNNKSIVIKADSGTYYGELFQR